MYFNIYQNNHKHKKQYRKINFPRRFSSNTIRLGLSCLFAGNACHFRQSWWDEHVEEEEYTANAEGLEKFINEHLRPICFRMSQEARFTPAIKAQTQGEGLQAHRLEKLNRYETHLDRKFEGTLAMILKMKELRNGK